MTHDEILDIFRREAPKVRNALIKDYILNAPDIPGIEKEMQMMAKLSILCCACEDIVNSVDKLNNQIGSGLDNKEKENKEWN